ncbi:MAG: carboxypeptidase regulatory-like domain-containing protein [Deltaproteobacteria bacterium]|nr:carboxypeptidase regulatory-like domain-containing protein [Deltaproteobacteria bacterium]
MKNVGKTLARAALGVLTAGMGFVIAACYGAMYAFQGGGRVVDARSQQGVAGARVDCRQGGQSIANTETAADGSYDFGSYPCDEVSVQDASGHYQPQTVPARPNGTTYVELQGTK